MPNRPLKRAATVALSLLFVPAAASAQAAALASLALITVEVPGLVVVPDVRGQTLSGAAERVAVAGLVPRHAASNSGNVDTSPVRRQWPVAGERVPQGTVVALELAAPIADAVAATESPASTMAGESSRWIARTAVSAIADAPTSGAIRLSLVWPWLAAVALTAALAALAFRRPRAAAPGALAPPASPDAGGGSHPLEAALAADHAQPSEPLATRIRATRGRPRFAVVRPRRTLRRAEA